MGLLICNGSPRGKESNSSVIASWFIAKEDSMIFLNNRSRHKDYIDLIRESKKLVFIYPLYVDAMPGFVKSFYETIENSMGNLQGKEIAFIIHSGFNESVHLEILKRYHELLAKKLSFTLAGTIIIPGSEGFRLMPPQMTKSKHDLVNKLMNDFRHSNVMDLTTMAKLSGRKRGSIFRNIFYPVINKLGLTAIYWNSNLKKNNAFKKRFDRPY